VSETDRYRGVVPTSSVVAVEAAGAWAEAEAAAEDEAEAEAERVAEKAS